MSNTVITKQKNLNSFSTVILLNFREVIKYGGSFCHRATGIHYDSKLHEVFRCEASRKYGRHTAARNFFMDLA